MRRRRGVTLIEMMTVVAIIAIMVGISFPAITAGLDSVRLSSATQSLASFINGAMNRADRRQVVVQLSVSARENAVWIRSTEPGFVRRMEMPEGVSIADVLPEEESEGPRKFLFLPGGTPPRFSIVIANGQGRRRIVTVDPATGVPRIEVPQDLS